MARTSKAAQAKRAAQQAETATLEPEATAVPEQKQATATGAVAEAREDAPAAGNESEESSGPEQASGTDAGADAKESEQAKAPAPPKKTGQAKPATSAGMVEATLTARWASGGRAHKAGDKVRMTRGTYERLKKFGRVK